MVNRLLKARFDSRQETAKDRSIPESPLDDKRTHKVLARQLHRRGRQSAFDGTDNLLL